MIFSIGLFSNINAEEEEEEDDDDDDRILAYWIISVN